MQLIFPGSMKRLILFLAFLFLASPLQAASISFQAWINDFQREAIERGIRPETVYHALTNIYPDDAILEKDQQQPENTVTAADYWKRVVNPRRIARGREFMRVNHEMLSRIADMYGVQPRFIVALLGVESDYGDLQGTTNIIEALATLAYDGRRADFFKEELVNALRIIDQGHVRAEEMTGSWAGAMGYCQFMPSSFFKFAQDFDGDGRIDIWHSAADAAASAANYLRESGWKSGDSWGRKVRLTKPVPDSMLGLKVAHTISDWRKMGIVAATGKKLPKSAKLASLIVPDGGEGAAFLVYNNFNVIMRWNRSTYFATSVGMIADKLGE